MLLLEKTEFDWGSNGRSALAEDPAHMSKSANFGSQIVDNRLGEPAAIADSRSHRGDCPKPLLERQHHFYTPQVRRALERFHPSSDSRH